MRQIKFRFRTWGGKRRGAGRKPRGATAGVSHSRRVAFAEVAPVHVTLRVERGVWNLRSRRCFRVLARAFLGGGDRFGFRLVHYAVIGNHVHRLVEAEDGVALARGMQGSSVRIARGLNRVMGRRGKVFADRYHARVLRTVAEVRNVRGYLASNARKHYGLVEADDFASRAPVRAPESWLVRQSC